jgi:EAL and modified HD-GYP domain-containing signal transduction protein
MLGSLFRRQGSSSAAPVAAQPNQSPAVHTQPIDTPAAGTSALATYGVRRPLISAKGDIAGFEFRLNEGMQRRLLERHDPAAWSAHVAALLTAMRLTAVTGRLAFAQLDADWLRAAELPGLMARGIVIGLTKDPAAEGWQECAGQLRKTGARIGWSERSSLAVVPDFRLVRLSEQPLEDLPAITQRWTALRSGAPLVVAEAASIDDLEAALRAGAHYASGETSARDDATSARPLPPQVLRVHRLLQHLGRDAELRQLAGEIKADVALTYRLLSFANSAAVGASREIDSIEQAILLLGRNELYRWLSIMLISSADGRPAARALQEIALARGQLLESLARERGDPRPDGFFTIGLASMLGVLLQIPLAMAIEPLRLPEPAQQALLEGRGPWRAHLELALLLERHKTVEAESPAAEFGGLDRVLALADRAWSWAAESTAELRS